MNYGWFFQATDRMPAFSFLQNVTTVVTSLYFLACFRPGEPVGNDLWVTMVFNGLATMFVYWHLHRRLGMVLIDRDGFRAAWDLFREGRPTWAFNLTYFAMANMGLPLVSYFLGEAGNREAGYFRSSMVLVAACQAFLSYFALMLNPRIVRWRQEDPQAFCRRLTALVVGLCGVALLAFIATWFLREPVFLLLGKAYQPGARVLPALVSAKFLALASGFLVWGLFACRQDWLAVRCCAAPLAVSLLLHAWLVPRWGIDAAGWLNLGSEALLLALCWMAFRRHARPETMPA
jgi:O-antigen/teichoic acid export membrane protein